MTKIASERESMLMSSGPIPPQAQFCQQPHFELGGDMTYLGTTHKPPLPPLPSPLACSSEPWGLSWTPASCCPSPCVVFTTEHECRPRRRIEGPLHLSKPQFPHLANESWSPIHGTQGHGGMNWEVSQALCLDLGLHWQWWWLLPGLAVLSLLSLSMPLAPCPMESPTKNMPNKPTLNGK